jgi:hypothetical protein
MYLGNKSMKFDNVNGVAERKWHGPGTVVTGISAAQADKLVAHKEEFLDVTAYTEKDIATRAARARADSEERVRRAHRPAPGSPGIMLEYATDEQLAAEVKRRAELAGIQATPDPKHVRPKKPGQGNKEKPETPKDQASITEAVERAIGVLLERNNPDDFQNGIPRKEAVEAVIDFSLTDTEYEIALGSKAPAEFDKSGFQDNSGEQSP